MTKKQYQKICDAMDRLLEGGKIRGLPLSLCDIRAIQRLLENLNNKPEFINGNVKKFCDKYGINVVEHGVGWKVV